MIKVTLYTKEDCCLCLEAKNTLKSLQKRYQFMLEEIDITSRSDLYENLREEIPVIFINDRKSFKYRVDPQQFVKKLKQASLNAH